MLPPRALREGWGVVTPPSASCFLASDGRQSPAVLLRPLARVPAARAHGLLATAPPPRRPRSQGPLGKSPFDPSPHPGRGSVRPLSTGPGVRFREETTSGGGRLRVCEPCRWEISGDR